LAGTLSGRLPNLTEREFAANELTLIADVVRGTLMPLTDFWTPDATQIRS
jgi:hypothetical protein